METEILAQSTGERCWNWRGKKNHKGYGYIQHNGKTTGAHRAVYEVFKGLIPKGLFVCHSCDNPACVNPAHLWTGTVQDNVTDMMRKGRWKPNVGIKNGRAKINPIIALNIRMMRKIYGWSYVKLGKFFEMDQSHMWEVCKGIHWK